MTLRRAEAPTSGERGSGFVDAIVASAIVALALSAAFRVIAETAGRERGVDSRRSALLVAQSELDAVGSAIPLEAGQRAGIVDDMIWRVEVSPYLDAGGSNAAGGLWRVVVAVRPRAGGRDLVTLESLRLGRNT
jgi:hypothetical protein